MLQAYLLPFVLYLLGTNVVSLWPEFYAAGYAIVALVVSLATWWLLRGRGIVTPHRRIGAAVLVGIVGIALWIGLSELRLEARIASYFPEWLRPGPRPGYDPNERLTAAWAIWGFVLARLWGLVVLVPIAEELFWRGFLNRWIQSPHWEEVPVGRFTVGSFVTVTLLFALAHPEWLAAACYCARQRLVDVEAGSLGLHRRPRDQQLDPRLLHSPDRILVAVVTG